MCKEVKEVKVDIGAECSQQREWLWQRPEVLVCLEYFTDNELLELESETYGERQTQGLCRTLERRCL